MNHLKSTSTHYDLAVCGAGPGGLAAAVAASRLGKKVLLIEGMGCLGGYWTSGLMGISLDMPGKGGIPREIVNVLLDKSRAQWVDAASYTYDIESMKLLLETLALDAGVDIQLYTQLAGVEMDGNRIRAVHTTGMQSQTFSADFFVDGTGHGLLGKLAGCQYREGYEGRMQPGSLEAIVTGVPKDLWHSNVHGRETKRRLKEMLMSVGVDCTYQMPLLFALTPDGTLCKLAVNHEYGVVADDPRGMTLATLDARREINRAVDALRTLPGWESLTLCQTAEQLGLRDARRIHGVYTLNVEDALAGKRFEDGVSPVHFSLDVHALAPDYVLPPEVKSYRFRPFDVPMRSLIAADVENLFTTGRCIGGDFLAHSAYRTTCTACALGEAAGIAAAHLSSDQCAADTDGVAIHQEMIRRGYDFKLNRE